jgi:hypothetical protein
MSPWERVLGALEAHDCNPRGSGDKREFQCPLHSDRHASASAKVADGRVLVCCHVCGPDKTEEVLACLDLTMADLFEGGSRNGKREVAVYVYRDEGGTPLFEVGRFEPKRFLQRLPGRSDWKGGIGKTGRVLYHLPEVIEAVRAGKVVYCVEGEADVHAIEHAGAIATCNPGGAGKWRPEYSEHLRGAEVVLVADKDDTGRGHAEAVRAALVGVEASVRVVEAATGKDASDHLRAGYGLDEFRPVEPGSENGTEPEPVSGPKLALDAARVDLIELMTNGIPERTFLPLPFRTSRSLFLPPLLGVLGELE